MPPSDASYGGTEIKGKWILIQHQIKGNINKEYNVI